MHRWVLCLCLLASACGGPPPVELPRLPVVGGTAEELGIDHVTVTVNAAGQILTADGPTTPEQLTTWLTPHARRSRDTFFVQQPSHVHLVIRGDWTAPWSAVDGVLRAAADPDNRMNRVLFAVRPDGASEDEEGTFAWFLPLDHGLGDEGNEEDLRMAHVTVLPQHALQGVLMLAARLHDAGYRPWVIVGDEPGLSIGTDDGMLCVDIESVPPIRPEASRSNALVGVTTLTVPIEEVVEPSHVAEDAPDVFPRAETIGK